jgi:hypothetical protein
MSVSWVISGDVATSNRRMTAVMGGTGLAPAPPAADTLWGDPTLSAVGDVAALPQVGFVGWALSLAPAPAADAAAAAGADAVVRGAGGVAADC